MSALEDSSIEDLLYNHMKAGLDRFNDVLLKKETKETNMTKEEALQTIKLLSALESWAFSTKTLLPDYLHDDLHGAMKVLEKIVLEKP